ncbi:uncharacterized protein SPPG_03747 [Spizellomyces punctatus DAOM BR117]|uniref:Uncharacterized protein n=1 Tax=Spizellomyces punctatus (strain DAOM BR117) TaxID=645134 RepID=A0A0L0HIH0_SPIPD|nr:uncharacterized protein SPPG_03747 [Spizellomyces punctatus DAOM BR117]KND00619.1 hypothetical protein SPPG_03747 [Spizellomyces punctatus DAOM BR117]|eukprot:XP_016608658.1 hypothetical protein SPPG_03747 [Spizellomyces punctatus DAOM BR117]
MPLLKQLETVSSPPRLDNLPPISQEARGNATKTMSHPGRGNVASDMLHEVLQVMKRQQGDDVRSKQCSTQDQQVMSEHAQHRSNMKRQSFNGAPLPSAAGRLGGRQPSTDTLGKGSTVAYPPQRRFSYAIENHPPIPYQGHPQSHQPRPAAYRLGPTPTPAPAQPPHPPVPHARSANPTIAAIHKKPEEDEDDDVPLGVLMQMGRLPFQSKESSGRQGNAPNARQVYNCFPHPLPSPPINPRRIHSTSFEHLHNPAPASSKRISRHSVVIDPIVSQPREDHRRNRQSSFVPPLSYRNSATDVTPNTTGREVKNSRQRPTSMVLGYGSSGGAAVHIPPQQQEHSPCTPPMTPVPANLSERLPAPPPLLQFTQVDFKTSKTLRELARSTQPTPTPSESSGSGTGSGHSSDAARKLRRSSRMSVTMPPLEYQKPVAGDMKRASFAG